MDPNPPAAAGPLPTLFISHGSPMIALEPGAAGRFLQRLGPALVARHGRPRALLFVSAHTLARRPVLLAAPRHEAIHDFGNFDRRLFALRYDAPGAPALAERAAALLRAAGIAAEVAAEAGGLDHGIWTPLLHLFPQADIPVLPLAWPPDASPAQLLALGRALAPLRDDGVLIVGSGSITHNLRRAFAGGLHDDGGPATPESAAFRDWFAERAAAGDWPALLDWAGRAPHAALMHPTDEHLLPFFVAAGAAGEGAVGKRIHASSTLREIGMDLYAFDAGDGAADAANREQS